MSPSDFITQRQAAFGEFLDSSFLADVHIRSAGSDSSAAVRLHSAVLAAASGFWRETFSDGNVQDESGCFTVIVEGLGGDLIEAVAALLYRGQIAVGSDGDAGAFRSAFAELIVPDSKGSLDLIGPGGINEDKENDEKTTERLDLSLAVHKCDLCENRTFRYAKDLAKHRLVHTGELPFSCSLCEKRFRNSSNLYKHLRGRHGLTRDQLRDHKPKSNKDRKRGNRTTFRCSLCPMDFATDTDRNVHTGEAHKGMAPFECDLCLKTFSIRAYLNSHKRNAHGMRIGRKREYQCGHCGISLPGKVALAKHKLRNHRDLPEQLCPICGKGFVTAEQLNRHIPTHSERTRELKCSFCPKAFFRRDVLKTHEKTHDFKSAAERTRVNNKSGCTNESLANSVLLRRFACSVCLKLFDSAAQQRTHERTEHGENRRPKHIEIQFATTSVIACQHCKVSSFKNLYSLKRHLAKHKCPLVNKGADIQECDVCKADEITHDAVRRHVAVNNQRRVHACDVCRKRFRTPQELSNHAVTHSGQRPFECAICRDRFSQQASLNHHMLRHQEEQTGAASRRSDQFEECSNSFEGQNPLNAHQSQHEREDVVESDQATLVQVEIVTSHSDEN